MRKIILLFTVFASLIALSSCGEQITRIDKIVCQPSEYDSIYEETKSFSESSIHITLNEVGQRTSVLKMSDYENADNLIDSIESMNPQSTLADYSNKAAEYDHVCRAVTATA